VTLLDVRQVRKLTTSEKSELSVYSENFGNIFSDTNAQTSIRSRIVDEFQSLEDDEMLIASYTPRSGRDKGQVVEHFYISPTIRRVIWLKDTAIKRKNSIVKRDKLGTLWTSFNWNNVTKEGDVQFPNGKKPEALLQTIFELATETDDLILDSFLGSGTTAAVAHKMGRRWIGIEMGEHAATHCLPRLQKVIDGEQGGISKAVGWQGGGGFRFMKLGAPVFDENGRIHPDVRFATLAAFIWQQETGATLEPSAAKRGTPYLGTHYIAESLPQGDDETQPLAPAIKKPAFACYLLFNGILGDKRPASGNVLTQAVLDALLALHAATPEPTAPLLVYGEACRLGEERLRQANATFRHIPYDVKAR
jgi:adenine-specific DNA-methyltransferase